LSTTEAKLSCTPDAHIRPPRKIKVGTATDQYTCYGWDAKLDQKRHVTGLAPALDQSKYLHHLLLYQVSDKDAAALAAGPTDCANLTRSDWRLVTGWAPGGKPLELPPAAGFPEETGTTHWALEIHYSNPKGDAAFEDETGYDLCTTEKLRPNDADVMRTGTENFVVGPRQDKTLLCSYSMPKAMSTIHVISASPHMHDCGREIFAVAPGGNIVSRPHFDQANQYASPANVGILPGERVSTMCRWQNDDDRTVSFGERTGLDEMCYVYMTYYPKITTPGWRWTAPAEDAVCWDTNRPKI
jgi:hypothetical protein